MELLALNDYSFNHTQKKVGKISEYSVCFPSLSFITLFFPCAPAPTPYNLEPVRGR